MTYELRSNDPIVPTEVESNMARDASRILATLSVRHDVHIEVLDDDKKRTTMILPPAIVRMVQHLLTEMAQGNAVTIMPMNAELTTQEAAEFLNVSRPFIVKQIEAGAIAHRKVGTHRRIGVQELLTYKKNIDRARSETLDELTAEAQKLGLGY